MIFAGLSDELYRDVARLASVQAIKIPAPPLGEAATRIPQLRQLIGATVVVGVSGDSLAAASMLAGCPAWFSVVAELLPEAALTITRAAQSADATQATEASDRLGLIQTVNLPRPLRPLDGSGRHQLDQILDRLGLLTRTEEGPPCTQ